jgi:hypothetical protein
VLVGELNESMEVEFASTVDPVAFGHCGGGFCSCVTWGGGGSAAGGPDGGGGDCCGLYHVPHGSVCCPIGGADAGGSVAGGADGQPDPGGADIGGADIGGGAIGGEVGTAMGGAATADIGVVDPSDGVKSSVAVTGRPHAGQNRAPGCMGCPHAGLRGPSARTIALAG